MNFGTLSAPVPSPGSGVYAASQTFSLSAASRDDNPVHDKRDGSHYVLACYTGPLSFQVSTTLKAKAFHPDYTQSATATATYSIKAETPVLSLPAGATPRAKP